MKKSHLFLGLLVLSFVLVATSCNGSKKENTDKKADKLETTQKVEVTKGKPIHITKAEFLQKVANYEANPTEWKYLGDKPCVIDFYADWCKPCKMIAPILNELATEYENDIYIYKVNIDEQKELAKAFGIRSIPTILFVPQTEKPMIMVGGLPKETLKDKIDNFLLKK